MEIFVGAENSWISTVHLRQHACPEVLWNPCVLSLADMKMFNSAVLFVTLCSNNRMEIMENPPPLSLMQITLLPFFLINYFSYYCYSFFFFFSLSLPWISYNVSATGLRFYVHWDSMFSLTLMAFLLQLLTTCSAFIPFSDNNIQGLSSTCAWRGD